MELFSMWSEDSCKKTLLPRPVSGHKRNTVDIVRVYKYGLHHNHDPLAQLHNKRSIKKELCRVLILSTVTP